MVEYADGDSMASSKKSDRGGEAVARHESGTEQRFVSAPKRKSKMSNLNLQEKRPARSSKCLDQVQAHLRQGLVNES